MFHDDYKIISTSYCIFVEECGLIPRTKSDFRARSIFYNLSVFSNGLGCVFIDDVLHGKVDDPMARNA